MFLKDKVTVTFLCTFILGCQSAGVYKVQTYQIKDLNFQVIQISPDRIQQKCIFLGGEDGNEWRHQYLMFILNNKDEVLEVAHAHNMDIGSCKKHIVGVEKILNSSSNVNLCVRDQLKKKNSNAEISWEEKADFGPLGVHKVGFESLTFDTICNSKSCYGDNSAYTYTCPGFVKQ